MRSCASCRAIRSRARGCARSMARCTRGSTPRRWRRRGCWRIRPRWRRPLGFSAADVATPEFAQVFGGNALLDGMQPYAANYGGHQFGNWAGQLGDGRAISLGEVDQRRRRALGAAAEGRRADAVFAQRRWPRGAALVGARVPVQRGDASPGRADHARAVPGRHRRAGGARHVLRRPRRAGAGRDRVPRRAVVHPLRQLRAARLARRHRAAAPAGRLHHPPRFPGTRRGRARRCTRRGSPRCASAPPRWSRTGCAWVSCTA